MTTEPTATLHRGDCLEFLAPYDGAPIDLVLADPPYCSGGATVATATRAAKQAKTRKDLGWFEGDNMGPAGLAWQLRSLCVLAMDHLSPVGSILIFCDWRMVCAIAPACESAGLRMRNLLVWDKVHFGNGAGFRPQHELVIHLSHRTTKFHRHNVSSVLRAARVPPRDKTHATEKPVEILAPMIEVCSPPGGLVFDPYAGSGSSAEAALSVGRNWIGCEMDARHHATAAARIAAAA